jgi:hypothetical protein
VRNALVSGQYKCELWHGAELESDMRFGDTADEFAQIIEAEQEDGEHYSDVLDGIGWLCTLESGKTDKEDEMTVRWIDEWRETQAWL